MNQTNVAPTPKPPLCPFTLGDFPIDDPIDFARGLAIPSHGLEHPGLEIREPTKDVHGLNRQSWSEFAQRIRARTPLKNWACHQIDPT